MIAREACVTRPQDMPAARKPESRCPCLRRRSTCVHHGGRSICEHRRLRRLCQACVGSGICEHQRRREICVECNPLGNLWARVRSATRRGLLLAPAGRRSRTHLLVGCSREHARAFIAAKMATWNAAHAEKMTFANVHIDHIKPLGSLQDGDSLARVCHFTNLQPLLLHDNERKSDRWSAHDEEQWRSHISGNAASTAIYWPVACAPLHAAGLGWEGLHLLAGAALASPPCTPTATLHIKEDSVVEYKLHNEPLHPPHECPGATQRQ